MGVWSSGKFVPLILLQQKGVEHGYEMEEWKRGIGDGMKRVKEGGVDITD